MSHAPTPGRRPRPTGQRREATGNQGSFTLIRKKSTRQTWKGPGNGGTRNGSSHRTRGSSPESRASQNTGSGGNTWKSRPGEEKRQTPIAHSMAPTTSIIIRAVRCGFVVRQSGYKLLYTDPVEYSRYWECTAARLSFIIFFV